MVFKAAERPRHEVATAPPARGAEGGYLARAAGGGLLLRVVSVGLVFACHLLLTRSLGALAYGPYAYALAWMKALSVPATLGLERLLVREVAVYHARSDWASWRGLMSWARRMLLLAAVGIALVAVALSWVVAGGADQLHPFWLAMALLPPLAFLRLNQYVMQGMHRAVVGQLPEALVHPLLLCALLAGYYAFVGSLTAAGAMGLNVAAMCAALVCGAALLGRTLPPQVKEAVPKAEPRVWMRSVGPLLLVSGVHAVNAQTPVLMLGAMRDAEAAGILSVAKSLADLTAMPAFALGAALTATLAALWAARDVRGLQRTITKCARGVTLVSLPPALALIVFGHPLLELFGPRFAAGSTALALLSVGHIVNMLTGSIGLLLVMTGREREVAFISMACALSNLGLCAALIPRWGMEGAAVGASASLILWNVWLARRARQLLGIRSTVFARLDAGGGETG